MIQYISTFGCNNRCSSYFLSVVSPNSQVTTSQTEINFNIIVDVCDIVGQIRQYLQYLMLLFS